MSERLLKLFENHYDELIRDYENNRQIPHPVTKGSSRENSVSNFLQRIIPAKYAISSGHLVTADSEWSKQLDIIIFDRVEAPILEDLGHDKIILVESALVAIEVKSCLERQTLKDVSEKANNVRSLMEARRFFTETRTEVRYPPALTGGFAFESKMTNAQIASLLKDQTREDGPDILCVLKDKEGNPGFFLTDKFRNITVFPDSKPNTGGHVLRQFVFELLFRLQEMSRFNWCPDLANYFQVFGMDKLSKLQELNIRFLRGPGLSNEEIIEMLYLMGNVPGTGTDAFQAEDGVFKFSRGKNEDGTFNVLPWAYNDEKGIPKLVSPKKAWEAARRYRNGKANEYDSGLLKVVVEWFKKMRENNEELQIQKDPDVWRQFNKGQNG